MSVTARPLDVMISPSWQAELARRVDGEVRFDAGSRAAFSVEVSRAAGERVLLPRVRAADPSTSVLAEGFSCRTQIEQGDTGRTAVHLAELLASGLPPATRRPAAPGLQGGA